VLLLVAGSISACGERSEGDLPPKIEVGPSAPGANSVSILAVTTRSPLDGNSANYTQDRGQSVSYANLVVSVPPFANRKIGEIQWPASPPGDPTKEFVVTRADRLNQSQAYNELSLMLTRSQERRVLLFVPGYTKSFAESVFRFAQIVNDAEIKCSPVLFSIPSKSDFSNFNYDQETAYFSRSALETTLQALSRNKSVRDVSIISNSLGNWLTLEALRQIAIRNGKISGKINDVILIEPDFTFDFAIQQIREMGSNVPRFSIFISKSNNWLRSPFTDVNSKAEPYKTQLTNANVDIIDLDYLTTRDPTNHSKFATSSIVADVGHLYETGGVVEKQVARGTIGAGQERLLAINVSVVIGYINSFIQYIWLFVREPTNLTLLVTLCGGGWTVFIFYINRRDKRQITAMPAISNHSSNVLSPAARGIEKSNEATENPHE
jgi:esterase/lipase superfamily enzyme